MNNRFQFPGFVTTKTNDTGTHEVEIGQIEDGSGMFMLELIRRKDLANIGVNFVVAKVHSMIGAQLWAFGQENFNGVGLLAKAGDSVVIALTGRGKDGKVERIVPFTSFVSTEQLGIRELALMKCSAADFLGKGYNLTPSEKMVRRVDIVRRDEARRLADEQTAKDREVAKQAAREERLSKLLARNTIDTFTADGGKRFGIPVLVGEWMSLPSGTNVVLVDSFDEVAGVAGKPMEAFKVLKQPGRNPGKEFPVAVYAVPPTANKIAAGPAVPKYRTLLIEHAGDARQVKVFPSMDTIRAAQAAGLNGGSYVAVDCVVAGGKYQVFAVRKDGITTLGNFAPLA